MKSLSELLQTLISLDVESKQNDPYSQIAKVKKRYVLSEEVKNNVIDSGKDLKPELSENDKNNVKTIIGWLNSSNIKMGSDICNYGKSTVDNGITYENIEIDSESYTSENIGNKFGTYEGNITYKHGWDKNVGLYAMYYPKTLVSVKNKQVTGYINDYSFYNSLFSLINNDKYALSYILKIKNLYKKSSNEVINTVNEYVLAYCRNIEKMQADFIQNIESVSEYSLIITVYNVLDKVVSSEIFDPLYKGKLMSYNFKYGLEKYNGKYINELTIQKLRNLLVRYCKVNIDKFHTDYTLYFENALKSTSPKQIKTNKTVSTTDLFQENELTIELIDESLMYNVKVNPNKNGIIKIPKEDSYIFAKKYGNERLFCEMATDYDEVVVKVDNGLEARLKAYIANFKADELNLITGNKVLKSDLGGIVCQNNNFRTVNVKNVNIDIDDSVLNINDNGIEIVASDKKIGIGRIDKDDNISTPYDNSIDEVSAKLKGYDGLFKLLLEKLRISENNFKYRCFNKNRNETSYNLDRLNSVINILDIAKKMEDIDYESFEYDVDDLNTMNEDFKYLWDCIVISKKNIMKYLSKLYEFKKGNYDELYTSKKITVDELFKRYNEVDNVQSDCIKNIDENITKIQDKFGDFFGDWLIQLITSRYNSSGEKFKNDVTGVDIYSVIDYLYKIDKECYVEVISKLSKTKFDYEQIIKRKWNYSVRYAPIALSSELYVSPEDACAVFVNYIYLRFILYKKVLENLKDKRDEYLRNRSGNELKLSLGSILNDLCNALIGGVKMFISNPSAPPPYISDNNSLEVNLDANLKKINENINSLLR